MWNTENSHTNKFQNGQKPLGFMPVGVAVKIPTLRKNHCVALIGVNILKNIHAKSNCLISFIQKVKGYCSSL